MVTAGTYQKTHHFAGEERLQFLQDAIQEVTREHGWHLDAWAILSNHYHFVGRCDRPSSSLVPVISKIHATSARAANRWDNTPGRKVWYQYWDTHLSSQAAYLARLRYVHFNPVHHGIVQFAEEYRWSSARGFLRDAEASFRRTVLAMPIGGLLTHDDF